MLVIEQLMVPIDFHSIFSPYIWKSMANNCLVQNVHFWVNYSFKRRLSVICLFSESQWGEVLF